MGRVCMPLFGMSHSPPCSFPPHNLTGHREEKPDPLYCSTSEPLPTTAWKWQGHQKRMHTTRLSPMSNLSRDEVQWLCRVCQGALTLLVFHNLYSILSCIIACPLLVWNTFYGEIYEHGRAQNNIISMQHWKMQMYLVKNEWETQRARHRHMAEDSTHWVSQTTLLASNVLCFGIVCHFISHVSLLFSVCVCLFLFPLANYHEKSSQRQPWRRMRSFAMFGKQRCQSLLIQTCLWPLMRAPWMGKQCSGHTVGLWLEYLVSIRWASFVEWGIRSCLH